MTAPPAQVSQLHALTGLRGIAALWVMLCHAWSFFGTPSLMLGPLDLGKLLALGWIGVLVFFVLSGFLLALPFAAWRLGQAARPDTGRYLLRRLLRVLPAYYLQLAVLVLLAWLSTGVSPLDSLRAVLAHLLLLFNLGEPPVRPLVGTWWTLTVEFGYYLVLPLLAGLMTRRGPWRLLLVALTVSALQHLAGWVWLHGQSIDAHSQFVSQLPGYLLVFALGSAGAWWVAARPEQSGRTAPANTLAVVGLLALATLMWCIPMDDGGLRFWQSPPFYFGWKPAVAVAVLLLVLSCAAPRSLLARALSIRPLRYLGDISYSVYLWHLPIILWLADRPFGGALAAQLQWLLAALLTLAVAHLSARLVERPGIALGKRWTANAKDTAVRQHS